MSTAKDNSPTALARPSGVVVDSRAAAASLDGPPDLDDSFRVESIIPMSTQSHNKGSVVLQNAVTAAVAAQRPESTNESKRRKQEESSHNRVLSTLDPPTASQSWIVERTKGKWNVSEGEL